MTAIKPQSAVKAISIIMIISIVSQLLGFVREMLIANAFGASITMDAYNMANGILGLLPMFLFMYIGVTYIPEYTRLRMNDGESAAEKFYSIILTLSLLVSIIIAILGYVFAPQLITIFASGFTGQARTLSIQLLRILVWVIPIQAVVNVFISTLNALRIHTVQVIVGGTINIFAIPAVIFLVQYWGIYVIVAVTISHLLISMWFYISYINKQGQKTSFSVDICHPSLKKTLLLALPTVAGTATFQISQIVDRTLSSGLPIGSVSILGYALKLAAIPMLIFTPFATVYFAKCSEQSALNDKKATLETLWRTIEILLALIVPIIIITIFMRIEVVRIAFERGAFTPKITEATAYVTCGYIIALAIHGIAGFISQTLLAYQDTRGLISRGIITLVVSATCSILLTPVLGVMGLVLGNIISGIVFILVLVFTLRKRWGPLELLNTSKEILKLSISAVICIVAMYYLRNILPLPDNRVITDIIRFGIVTVVGGGVYLCIALLLKVRSLQELVRFGIEKIDSVYRRIVKK